MKYEVFVGTIGAALLLTVLSGRIFAHCDGLDGPVVLAAQKALETGNVNSVLQWVKPDDEVMIQKAFQQTLTVRKLSPQAKELADMYFFETLVRIHRAGEGAPYTGLKTAGRDLGPAIPAADRALTTGSVEPLLELLTDKMQKELRKHFQHVISKMQFDENDVTAGREYVEAYVAYIHFVERVYESAVSPIVGHSAESDAPHK